MSAKIETLMSYTEALWREPNSDRLTQRFTQILRDEFNVTTLSLLRLTRPKPPRWETEDHRFAGFTSIGGERLSELGRQWQLVDLKSQEYREGIHDIVASGVTFQFLRMGEQGHGTIMVWAKPDLTMEEAQGLDFIGRQAQNIMRLIEKLDETQALLHRDGLTGLYNYRYLDISLDAEIRRAQRFQSKFCLLFIDLDNFKPINDQFGHLSGSEVLKQVADVLREDLREVDSVFRYGGDEYVVLLLEANSITGAMTAERIRKKIEKTPFRAEDGKTVHITASIGVAACPEHSLSKETLLKMADQSMYKSKNGGKNRVFVLSREQSSDGAAAQEKGSKH